jgi:hypothetical protein
MRYNIPFLILGLVVFSSCDKEADHDHGNNTNTSDTTPPVVTINSPVESMVYHNGDTVFITGSVSDLELHGGTILLKNDTSLNEYLNQYHNVHQLTNANISFQYIVTGITQNEAVTLTATYEDHTPNYSTITRHLIFMP